MGVSAGTDFDAATGTANVPSGFNRVTRETSGGVTGPVLGVVSKSTKTSLRLYNGRNKYSEWAFVATEATTQGGIGGGVPPGGRGGRGAQMPGFGGRGGQAPGLGGRGGQQPPGMGGRGGLQMPGMGGARGMPRGSSSAPLQLPGMGSGRGTLEP